MHLRDRCSHVRIDGALRQTEVQNLDPAIRCDDDVVAFQIAMDDAPLVRMRERIRQLPSVVHDMLRRHRAGVQHRAERPSFDQLHGDIGLPLGFADFVHRADVRMIERGGGARFTHQPGACGGIVKVRGQEAFDGDVSIELLVAGPIHLAHSTSAESADDAVVRKPPAIHCGFWAAFYPRLSCQGDRCVALLQDEPLRASVGDDLRRVEIPLRVSGHVMDDVELARLRTAHADRADLRHRRAIEDRHLHRP